MIDCGLRGNTPGRGFKLTKANKFNQLTIENLFDRCLIEFPFPKRQHK